MNIDLAEEMAREYIADHKLDEWSFKWDRAKTRMGLCDHIAKTISMSKQIVEVSTVEEVQDTILHEIAHALVGPGHSHSKKWQRKVTEIGGSSDRCYPETEANIELAKSQIKYRTTCEVCSHTYTAMRRPRNVSQRYCTNTYECRLKNRPEKTRVYLVWYENTKYGPVRAHD